MDWTILWWLLSGLIIIAGLAGTVVPALPGVPLVFLGLFVGAWIGDFETIGWVTIGVLAVLTLIAWIVDFVAGAAGARYLGAPCLPCLMPMSSYRKPLYARASWSRHWRRRAL